MCRYYGLADAHVGSDFLQQRAKGSTMYGFKGGPAGVMKCKYVELNTDFVYPYRNQVISSMLHASCGLTVICKVTLLILKSMQVVFSYIECQ